MYVLLTYLLTYLLVREKPSNICK